MERFASWLSETMATFLGPINDLLNTYLLNFPPQAPFFAILLLGTGLFVTLRLGFIQVRGFAHAIAIARGKYDDPDDDGDLKHFQALTTALSATVGIGNIAGVAIAIRLGGPGALFWMWVTAFFGMALKFAECTLALAYRKVNPDGSVSGGPMYYMELGIGTRWAKVMAIAFATFTVICSFATGNMNQANTMAVQVESQFGIPPVWTALTFAFLVGLVIIGGIRRIGRVTSILAPFMALLYVGAALLVIFLHLGQVPETFALVFRQAFAPEPLIGGAAGSFLMTLMWGIRRGLFSNEAGQGSAPIAHAAAKTKEPVREGLVASLGPFIDTLVICTMTGLVILISNAWRDKVEQQFFLNEVEAVAVAGAADADLHRLRADRDTAGERSFPVRGGSADGATFVYLDSVMENARLETLDGVPYEGTVRVATDGAVSADDDLRLVGGALLTSSPLTARAFQIGLPGTGGDMIVTLAVLLFAVSTAISWSYYGDRATEYLFGARAIGLYRWMYIGFFFLGSLLPLQTVWDFGDVALGLMSFPNLVTLLLLSGTVVRMTREYMRRQYGK